MPWHHYKEIKIPAKENLGKFKASFPLANFFARSEFFRSCACVYWYMCVRDKQQKPPIMFAAAKIRVRMISTFSRRKLSLTNQISVFLYTSLSVFKMADIEEQELNSNVSNNEIVNETSQSQPHDNFDKGMFLEEVRKYRCLWNINNESYKIRPVKQNA